MGKQATFVVNQYKNSDLLGPRKVEISKSLTTTLKQFLKYRSKIVKHDFLLTDMKNNPMNKASFGKSIQKIMETLTSKRIGSRIFRIMHANQNKDIIFSHIQNLNLNKTKYDFCLLNDVLHHIGVEKVTELKNLIIKLQNKAKFVLIKDHFQYGLLS